MAELTPEQLAVFGRAEPGLPRHDRTRRLAAPVAAVGRHPRRHDPAQHRRRPREGRERAARSARRRWRSTTRTHPHPPIAVRGHRRRHHHRGRRRAHATSCRRRLRRGGVDPGRGPGPRHPAGDPARPRPRLDVSGRDRDAWAINRSPRGCALAPSRSSSGRRHLVGEGKALTRSCSPAATCRRSSCGDRPAPARPRWRTCWPTRWAPT